MLIIVLCLIIKQCSIDDVSATDSAVCASNYVLICEKVCWWSDSVLCFQ